MRDQMIKLYVDDVEMEMVKRMAKERGLPINRFLREMLAYSAVRYYPIGKATLFNRIYTKRNEIY